MGDRRFVHAPDPALQSVQRRDAIQPAARRTQQQQPSRSTSPGRVGGYRHSTALKKLFTTYSKRSVQKGGTFDEIGQANACIDFTEFMRFGADFKLIPGVFSRNAFKGLFHRANTGPGSDDRRANLSFPEFRECMSQVVAQSHINFRERKATMPPKIASLENMLNKAEVREVRETTPTPREPSHFVQLIDQNARPRGPASHRSNSSNSRSASPNEEPAFGSPEALLMQNAGFRASLVSDAEVGVLESSGYRAWKVEHKSGGVDTMQNLVTIERQRWSIRTLFQSLLPLWSSSWRWSAWQQWRAAVSHTNAEKLLATAELIHERDIKYLIDELRQDRFIIGGHSVIGVGMHRALRRAWLRTAVANWAARTMAETEHVRQVLRHLGVGFAMLRVLLSRDLHQQRVNAFAQWKLTLWSSTHIPRSGCNSPGDEQLAEIHEDGVNALVQLELVEELEQEREKNQELTASLRKMQSDTDCMEDRLLERIAELEKELDRAGGCLYLCLSHRPSVSLPSVSVYVLVVAGYIQGPSSLVDCD